jgi:hypothetical protein
MSKASQLASNCLYPYRTSGETLVKSDVMGLGLAKDDNGSFRMFEGAVISHFVAKKIEAKFMKRT